MSDLSLSTKTDNLESSILSLQRTAVWTELGSIHRIKSQTYDFFSVIN
jgi:hypothetical protein